MPADRLALPDPAPGPGSPLGAPRPAGAHGAPSSVPSAALLQGRSMVHIEHNGALYQLRSTRLGKLILTK
jgi:hemin uptake protein HemP